MAMKSASMNKKGMLYLFLSVIFVVLFVTIYTTYNSYDRQDDAANVAIRIHTIDDFIEDLHSDMDRAAYISGFRAMIGVEEYLSTNGAFFDNQTELEETFRTVFVQGTVNGSQLDVMENSSFDDYLLRVQQQATYIGINVDVNITKVNITQNDPWILSVRFTGLFNISDQRLPLWWAYEQNFTTSVPIIGLKDPLYTVNTLGRVPNVILNFTLPSDGYVNDTNNDTTTLIAFLEGSYYAENTDAPSFLQRFTNDLTASDSGIESLVHLPSLSDQGIVVDNSSSVVDHIYFSATPGSADRCTIDEMVFSPDWFKIDNGHVNDYELNGLTFTPC